VVLLLPVELKQVLIHTGDEVDIIGLGAEKLKSVVTGVEMFRKILDDGEAGDNVGLLLRGIDKEEIKRGMVIAKPGSITPHTKFQSRSLYPEKRRRWPSHSIP
jgi:elongation factor Tu